LIGEELGAKLWQMMDEDEIKEVSQLCPNLGTVKRIPRRKAADRVRLADVVDRLVDGLLNPPNACHAFHAHR